MNGVVGEGQVRSAKVKMGTIADKELTELAKDGSLFHSGFCQENVDEACYQLRASTTFYRPPSQRSMQAEDQRIVIHPHQLVIIITEESLDLPNDIIGRILTKGSLFSLGISAVNTYADPGFKGNLGIALHNHSHN